MATATTVPHNARLLKDLLVQYLTASKGHMGNKSDQAWVQAEIDRYNEQIGMITHGVERPRVKKATGIARRIDDLGRIVVPKELRTTLGIAAGDAVEIFVDPDNETIVLQKYEPACNFCNENTDEVTLFRGKRICESCLEELFNHTSEE